MSTSMEMTVQVISALLLLTLLILLIIRFPRKGKQESLPWNQASGHRQFNPPPGWPQAPPGWVPPPGWQPDPSWPPAPDDWQFWR